MIDMGGGLNPPDGNPSKVIMIEQPHHHHHHPIINGHLANEFTTQLKIQELTSNTTNIHTNIPNNNALVPSSAYRWNGSFASQNEAFAKGFCDDDEFGEDEDEDGMYVDLSSSDEYYISDSEDSCDDDSMYDEDEDEDEDDDCIYSDYGSESE